MSVPIAAEGHVGIRKEESFGSGGAAVEFQPIYSEDITINKNYYYGDFIMNTQSQVGSRLMNVGLAGSITFPVSPDGPEQWWIAGIGGASSPYAPDRPLKSLVLEIDKETAAIYTSGDMVASLEFSSSQSNPLQCVATIEGKGYQKDTASSPSFTSGDDPYLHNEATFEVDDVELTDVTAFTLSINNNLITDLYANQKERVDIPASKCVITGSFTKLFQDTDELDDFLAEDPVKLEVTYARGSNSFKFQLNKIKLDNATEPLAGQGDYIAETFNFTAFIDDVDNDVLTLTVV